MTRLLLFGLLGACVLAGLLWGRSARMRYRNWVQVREHSGHGDAKTLARADFQKDLHTTILYLSASVGVAAMLAWGAGRDRLAMIVLFLPVAVTLDRARNFRREARLALERSELERRAQEVLVQEDLAPRRWAARLAPDELPSVKGLEVGSAYQPGSGMMAGDFYDVVELGRDRVAAVVGDVSGHGIESSISALQAKYLLRVFLRQFRDPAQAFEQLNGQLSNQDRPEEFISALVLVVDTNANTLRYCSAGHPAAFLWHGREIQPLPATGPLLMLDSRAEYSSREVPLESGDLVVAYTDGLSEARAEDQLFGEDRIGQSIRRDPLRAPDEICAHLLDDARVFASGPISDDVAVLAVRRN